MNFAEEKISELRILLCKQYSKALSNKLNVGIIAAKEHNDYKFYRMLIYYILLSKIKDGIVKKALKDKAISEDESKKGETDIQKLTDDFIKKVDQIADEKEKSILTI